jgi:hypothetical protein
MFAVCVCVRACVRACVCVCVCVVARAHVCVCASETHLPAPEAVDRRLAVAAADARRRSRRRLRRGPPLAAERVRRRAVRVRVRLPVGPGRWSSEEAVILQSKRGGECKRERKCFKEQGRSVDRRPRPPAGGEEAVEMRHPMRKRENVRGRDRERWWGRKGES